jgi:electron transport complex protein RnfG
VTGEDVDIRPDSSVKESPEPADEKRVSSLRIILTLSSAGAIAGLLLVFVYRATLPAIEAHKAEVLRQAVNEVLKGPARCDTLYVAGEGLAAELPYGYRERDVEKVYLGYDAVGRAMGFAVQAGEPGFQDIIELIYGFDPAADKLLGMKILESKETPGLGDKIEKDQGFVTQFDGARPPLLLVKRAGGAENEVDSITGATISSRAVVRIINRSLERLRPALEARFEEAAP